MRKFQLPLGTTEELDTAMPVSSRPPGTLVAAPDCHTRYWGPKRGSAAFTQAQEGPGTAAFYDAITLTNAYGTAQSYEAAFRDIGVKFTVDVWFRLEDLTYAAGKDMIGLYLFQNGGSASRIDIAIRGPNHTDHERMYVRLVTSPTRSTNDSAVTFTCTTRISTGTSQTNKHHVRLVRDGANAYLYLDGVLDGSTSSLVATSPINAPLTTYGQAGIGLANFPATDINFKGHIYGACLRDGAFNSQPIEARLFTAPWARNVHHFHLGKNMLLGSGNCFFDAGRFGVHAPITGTNSLTVSNDNTAPAPTSVQGLTSWTTLTNRSAISVMCGGQLCTAGVS